MKVLLVQRKLTHYRIPIFNAIADTGDLDLSVIHAGSATQCDKVSFREIRTRCIRLGQAHYLRGVISMAGNYDVIIAPLNPRSIDSVLARTGPRDYKVIYWGHGIGTSAFGNRLRASMARWADALILYSNEGKSAFEELVGNREKLFVAPNTLRVTNSGFNPDILRSSFLFVGRLQRRKGVDKLLKAFSKGVRDIPSHIRVEIVGDGDLRSELESLAQELGIAERVTFWGRVTDDSELRRTFQRALAYVSPDHVGLGVLHSFAYGVPVVTRQFGDHAPEVENITNGLTGILYDGSVSTLAHILNHFAQNSDTSVGMGRVAYRLYRNRRSVADMISGFSSALEYVASGDRRVATV